VVEGALDRNGGYDELCGVAEEWIEHDYGALASSARFASTRLNSFTFSAGKLALQGGTPFVYPCFHKTNQYPLTQLHSVKHYSKRTTRGKLQNK